LETSQKALELAERQLGPEHPDVATSLNNLAELYREQGRYAQAEPLQKRALAIVDTTQCGNSFGNLRQTASGDRARK